VFPCADCIIVQILSKLCQQNLKRIGNSAYDFNFTFIWEKRLIKATTNDGFSDYKSALPLISKVFA